jgi:hypothetical protein
MKYLTILTAFLILTIGLTACSNADPATATPTGMPQYRPIEVVGVTGPIPPFNPGGPNVKITLKNNGGEPVVQLKAVLILDRPYDFNFDVSAAAPLAAGQSISLQQALIEAGINSEATYTLEINATNQSGAVFTYNVQLMIGTPPPEDTTNAFWPGVDTYPDNTSVITVAAGEEFSIRYTITGDRFAIYREQYDPEMVKLVDHKFFSGDSQTSPLDGWYLFQAMKTGKTQITLEHRGHIALLLLEATTFEVIVR